MQLRNEKKYLNTISTEKNLASDELKQNRGKEENSERLAVNDIKINLYKIYKAYINEDMNLYKTLL